MPQGYRRDSFHDRPEFRDLRRKLRKDTTPAEQELWKHIRNSQVSDAKFRRQHGAGMYILDFYCPAARLAIELDGAVHDSEEAYKRDRVREKLLLESNIRVIRFRNEEVFDDIDGVLKKIADVLRDAPPPRSNASR